MLGTAQSPPDVSTPSALGRGARAVRGAPLGLLPSEALPAGGKATATVVAHREPAGWARPRWASSPGWDPWDPWDARLGAQPRLGVRAPGSGEAWLGARRSHQKTFVFLQVTFVTSHTEDGKGHTRVRAHTHSHAVTRTIIPTGI